MQASGNDDVMLCIANLFSMRRGEIAYNRVKGIDQDIIDEDIMNAEIDLIEDAEFVVDQFEPRADIDNMSIDPCLDDGRVNIHFDMIEHEDESEDVED